MPRFAAEEAFDQRSWRAAQIGLAVQEAAQAGSRKYRDLGVRSRSRRAQSKFSALAAMVREPARTDAGIHPLSARPSFSLTACGFIGFADHVGRWPCWVVLRRPMRVFRQILGFLPV